MLYNWESLKNSKTLEQIKKDWENLLKDETQNESAYHSFIASNPYFFISFIESYLAISKLKLGSEYESDFVVVKEGYSDGTIYEFIEIESPHTKLFDSKGKPTAKFSTAIQQIMDWKRFLIDEKSFFKKFLPTTSTKIIENSQIRFKIIIGRRLENKEDQEKRRQYAETNNIEIISFDRLTDVLMMRKNFQNEPMIHSGQMHFLDDLEKKNDLANPFFECVNDSSWKKICKAGHEKHFYTNYLDEILAHRTYSKYFEMFKEETIHRF
jgi:Domain of unknown function (DUF4263)